MIIKSHIRGGYRAAADYLKEQGQNEKIRLVEINDPAAKNLDEAFHNMWAIASKTRCTKPLHHISINPMKDERLTDRQVLAIVERLEMKFGYKPFNHQRVIVEHIKDGRQHFHVIWNRVSLETKRPVWPGHHWNKSKQAAREMEKELGLKRPTPNRTRRAINQLVRSGRVSKTGGRYQLLNSPKAKYEFKSQFGKKVLQSIQTRSFRSFSAIPAYPYRPPVIVRRHGRGGKILNKPEKMPMIRSKEWTTAELIAWAWANGRFDILAQFGIYVSPDFFEP